MSRQAGGGGERSHVRGQSGKFVRGGREAWQVPRGYTVSGCGLWGRGVWSAPKGGIPLDPKASLLRKPGVAKTAKVCNKVSPPQKCGPSKDTRGHSSNLRRG